MVIQDLGEEPSLQRPATRSRTENRNIYIRSPTTTTTTLFLISKPSGALSTHLSVCATTRSSRIANPNSGIPRQLPTRLRYQHEELDHWVPASICSYSCKCYRICTGKRSFRIYVASANIHNRTRKR